MESPKAAISIPDVAKNGAQSIIGVSPVSVSGCVPLVTQDSTRLWSSPTKTHTTRCGAGAVGSARGAEEMRIVLFPGT